MVRIRIINSEPALVSESEKNSLIVSDLHIGFEHKFASNKITAGNNSSINEIISNVKKLIKDEKPDSLILLGDIKSSIQNITKSEWNDVPYFFDEVKKMSEVILIPGNHDGNIQKLVPDEILMISSKGIVIDDTLLTHGHTMPSENFSSVNRIIMGHIHPVFFHDDSLVNGQRVWISLKTKKDMIFPSMSGEIEITILPAFNPYFYATEKRYYKKAISPIIEKVKNDSIAKIITLDGAIIGNEVELQDLL